MSEPKTEGASESELTQPTLDKFAVIAKKKPKTVKAVQFTQEVLTGSDPRNSRRAEGDIEFNIGHAVYFPAKGVELRIKCNDWLIINENGRKTIVPEGEFNAEWDVKDKPVVTDPILANPETTIKGSTAPIKSVAEILAEAKAKVGK